MAAPMTGGVWAWVTLQARPIEGRPEWWPTSDWDKTFENCLWVTVDPSCAGWSASPSGGNQPVPELACVLQDVPAIIEEWEEIHRPPAWHMRTPRRTWEYRIRVAEKPTRRRAS